jgi:hypothetical protein
MAKPLYDVTYLISLFPSHFKKAHHDNTFEGQECGYASTSTSIASYSTAHGRNDSIGPQSLPLMLRLLMRKGPVAIFSRFRGRYEDHRVGNDESSIHSATALD